MPTPTLYVLSIGLNVGSHEPAGQLGATLRATEAIFGNLHEVGMGASEWEGVPERFVQIAVRTEPAYLASALPVLARTLAQDAIAATQPDWCMWDLFYATGRRTHGGALSERPIILKGT